MANPHPQPTALQELHGNPGKKKKNHGEPKPKCLIPKCPSWFPENARIAWDELSSRLVRLGILSEIDVAAFTRYCLLNADWRECVEFLAAHGTDLVAKDEQGVVTGIVPYPHVKRKREIEVLMLRYEQEFGMTPSSRSKVAVQQQDDDALTIFLSKKAS